MRKASVRSMVCLCCAATVIASCTVAPITQRERIALIPSFLLMPMSFQSYRDFLAENELSADVEATQMVRRVGRRISAAVEEHFRGTATSAKLAGYAWEFNLIEDPASTPGACPGARSPSTRASSRSLGTRRGLPS